MSFLKIKIIVAQIFSIKIKNLFFSLIIKGDRGKDSVIIPIGKFHYSYEKNSRINIISGCLVFNQKMSNPDPFIGVLKLKKNAIINIQKGFTFFSGHHIIVHDNALLSIGSGYANYNLKIRCFNKISIGNNVAISENVTIWDTDAHEIVGKEGNMTQPVTIGDHVWIGLNVTILKGVTIGDGAIIAAGSLVNKDIPANCLAAGIPAKVVKENVYWK